MAQNRVSTHFADRLTSRRGAWLSLGIFIVLYVALVGIFSGASAPLGNDTAPPASESAIAGRLLEQFPGADQGTVMIVATREDGAALTAADRAALAALVPAVDAETGHDASAPAISEDERAAVITTAIELGASNTETAHTIKSLRTVIADHPVAGLGLLVTGGPAFGADIAGAFDGADFTLLAVTIIIVALLLIITYRSPILWLLPLVIVGLADQIAAKVTAAAGSALGLQFDAGIISVLVFGAGTNYALLLISRYREELFATADHRAALSAAWLKSIPAILASNVTVVLSLLMLVFAVIPGTRGLGISSAIGLVIALVAVLFGLPPLLAVCGRRVFWPFAPKPGTTLKHASVWHAIASRVVRRPALALVSGVVLLAVMALGLLGTSVGLTQVEKFRVPSESAVGLEVVGEHFPAGETQPLLVLALDEHAEEVVDALSPLAGVVRVQPLGDHAGRTKIMVTGEYAPGTAESLALVDSVRSAAHAVAGADALVGGASATDVDARAGNAHDLWLIAPLILLVSFIVLLLLLRSIIAPIVLMLTNLVSAVAAIGVGSWLSRVLFDQPALDLQVPLLAFLFLVALGIDYTIFLVQRARAEAHIVGTRQGMVQAVTTTGGVITSAGIVLAGVFAALGFLPLVTLGQLGLIVGVGVIVDTLVVRTVIVPALFELIGDKIWFPSVVAKKELMP